MVGHTGVFSAAVKAVEAVDECAGKVINAVLAAGGAVLLTADHGNADKMYDPDPEHPFTAHTANPVPFLVAGLGDVKLRQGGVLADIAPTMLKVMGLPGPKWQRQKHHRISACLISRAAYCEKRPCFLAAPLPHPFKKLLQIQSMPATKCARRAYRRVKCISHTSKRR